MFTAVISIPVVLIGIESGWVKNLVQNSSFEKGGDQSAKSWNTSTWSGDPIFRIDPGAGRTGNRSAAITSILGADASWSFRLQVKPNTDYRVSAWIKTDKLAGGGLGALINLHELQMEGKSVGLKGDNDWTQVTTEFNSGQMAPKR